MILAQYANISFGFHDKQIVTDFSYQLNEKCRVGLIGSNGSGKTTLLRLLNGELEPDKGSVILAKDLRVGFLRQTPSVSLDSTLHQVLIEPFKHLLAVEEQIEKITGEMATHPSRDAFDQFDALQETYRLSGGYQFRNQIGKVMGGLGFSPDDSTRLLKSFSGGEQARIMLAVLLLEEPDLMLLDEPTNHLDIQGVEFLEQYLESFRGGAVIISHDRYFLDRAVNTIVHLAWQKCEVYNGNYTRFRAEKAARDAIKHKHFSLQQDRIEKLEEFIRRNMAAQKTRQAQSRLKELNRMVRLDDIHAGPRRMKLRFSVTKQSGQIVLTAHDLAISFDRKLLFKGVNLKLHRGGKIGLIGANGSGKSTLLKILAAQIDPNHGSIEWGYHVTPAFFDQHLRELNDSLAIIDEVWAERPEFTNQEIRDHLGRFLFSGDDVLKTVGTLSGGEKARVALARLFLKDANLLFLDEPTNHLDLDARESLETALCDYPGSIVMVTHDRYLLDNVADKIWALENQHVKEYSGSYSDYKTERSDGHVVNDSGTAGTTDASLSKKSRKEQRMARLEVRKRTGKSAAYYEKQVERLEQELSQVREEMKNPEISHLWTVLDGLSETERCIQEELTKHLELWEKAAQAESDLNESS